MNVDTYIGQFSPDVQEILQKLRSIVRVAAPTAVESFAYGMPAYKLNEKPLVYFAAFSKHIGVYATPSTHESFAEQLARYKQGKGSVQFPLDQPIPYDLIAAMVECKVRELERGSSK